MLMIKLTTKAIGPSSRVEVKPDVLAVGLAQPVLVRRGFVAHLCATAAAALEAVSQEKVLVAGALVADEDAPAAAIRPQRLDVET